MNTIIPEINTTTIERFKSLDLLRGIVMILMALDHARWFMHISALTENPENLKTTTTALYFTRWVTHFCAPVFIFLVGISTYFSYKKKGINRTSHFLWKRGLFLIFLELTVFRVAWDGNLKNPTISLLVIWTIGISMIFLSFVIRWLNFWWILILGLVIVFGHNLLDFVNGDTQTFFGKLWIVLHVKGDFPITNNIKIFILYPALPYLGMVCLGFCFGKLYTQPLKSKRRKYLALLGLGSIILFTFLRYFNLYGDPNPWSVQSTSILTLLSFLKTTKYPTSFLYFLMTIGPALVLLYFAEKRIPKLFRPIIEIGQVPMFFYLIHLFVIKFVTVLGYGYNKFTLTKVYFGWFISCLILYVLCYYYRNYKYMYPNKIFLRYL